MRWLAAFLVAGLAAPASGQEILAAEFGDPTDRYAHAVLGDDLEWAMLRVQVADGSGTRSYAFNPSEDLVFEDLTPRLWDMTGDGSPEVVVVQSHQQLGARLVVIGLEDASPTILATTPFIGTRFRWLAPVAAADFDGDGRVEVAFVDRPHLAKTLRIFEYSDAGLTLEAEIPDLTNHRIGEDFITGGLRDCGQGPQMVTANGDWSQVMITDWQDGYRSRAAGPFSAGAITDELDCR